MDSNQIIFLIIILIVIYYIFRSKESFACEDHNINGYLPYSEKDACMSDSEETCNTLKYPDPTHYGLKCDEENRCLWTSININIPPEDSKYVCFKPNIQEGFAAVDCKQIDTSTCASTPGCMLTQYLYTEGIDMIGNPITKGKSICINQKI